MKNVSDSTQLTDKIPVYIPEDVIKKIRHLCTVIHNFEWSGVLFYTVEGTIKDPKNFKITLKDILPMDKGSTAATEFSYDRRYIDYLMNDPERTEWKSGLIHSHNNMAVFFSGTDDDELSKNSKAHNYYLSVVVNNKLDIIGRVAITASAKEIITAPFNALDEDGKPYIMESLSLSVTKDKLYHYECQMSYDRGSELEDSEFLNSVATILEAKKPTVSFPDYAGNYGGSNYKKDYAASKNRGYFQYEEEDEDFNSWRRNNKKEKKKKTKEDPLEVTMNESFIEIRYRKFLSECFGYGNQMDVSMEDILESLDAEIKSNVSSATSILQEFANSFEELFDEHFMSTSVIDNTIVINGLAVYLDNFSKDYPFIKSIINFLKKVNNG